MKRMCLLFTVLLGGCFLTEPEEVVCATVYHWSFTDSVDANGWTLAKPEPDSVTLEWSVDGECLGGEG